ncbi:unnamed protein product [Linum trigynum]|uniref:Gnk2-homologous domain-containing protein n=1 Tax=Linum trigynum TaxID=586398 RepID=A0AAV2FWX7_9ROSI
MEEYSYASSARKVAVWIALIALLGYACAGASAQVHCDSSLPIDTVPCHNIYGYCVTEVITALRDVTPNQDGFRYTSIYPQGTFGGVTGFASCSSTTDVEHCQPCLVGAMDALDDCKSYASGSFIGDVCTMSFAQFLPHE